jgi:arylsulfatase
MTPTSLPLVLSFLLSAPPDAAAKPDAPPRSPLAGKRPNVVIILADDLGYSDLGCYGGEIATPNLDALAKGGVRFSQFYNTARCWPSRASLLAGYYPQAVRRDTVPGVPSGSKGVRPPWAKLLPDLLKPCGYRSYHSGKWHVDGKPTQNGFDRSYWLEDCGRHFNPRVHFEDDKPLPAVERGSGYYTSAAIADHAVKYLKEHAASYAGTPFLAYVAFTAPHFPLHAPPEDIARYADRYRGGWEALRRERSARQREMGLLDCRLSDVEPDVGPPYHFPKALEALGPGEVNRPRPWAELTDQQRAFQAAKMAVHAAMVDRMDREIGRIIAQVREMGALDDTLILFLSDNGASAEIMVRDDGHDPAAAAGSAGSHLCLGPGWSGAANTPLRRHKTWVHEGGISTPLIAHWPKGIAARGEFRRTPGHLVDIVPTVLELAGGRTPETADGKPVPPPHGRSLTAALTANVPVSREELWWLHEGNRAVRVGDWKIVAAKGEPWSLYDLSADRSETKDLAAKHPEKIRELEAVWNRRNEECSALAKREPPPAMPASQPAGRKTGAD